MALKRCSSGHFFDQDRFSACPYCGGEDAAARTVPRAPASPRPASPGSGSEPPTEPLGNGPEAPPGDRGAAPTASLEGGVSPGMRGGEASARAGSKEDEGVTIGVAGQPRGVDPVVGWLVCVKGPDRGRDFRIRAERNFIGRSRDMDVALTEDQSVSRDRHAILSYDPRTHVFVLAPGEGRGLVYHNGTSVLTPVQVNAHDTIELGESTLRFIPLCGDDFSWS
ncbi:MAG: FHA domain-containing protein [Gemmatimonadetes bacterium]|nr:FHA domain-containing protein [Gemmatimonadota bacterium]